MKAIYKLTTSNINKKAEDLGLLIKAYNNSLFPTSDIFSSFVEELRRTIDNLNARYPRTKPFELYSVWEHGITITVTGRPDVIVAHFALATINSYVGEDGISPIEELIKANK